MGTAVETIMTTSSPFVNSKGGGGGGGACGHTEMKNLCKAASDTTTTTTSAAIADMVENLSKFTFTVPVTVQQPEKEGGEEEEEEEEILTKCECCGLAEECTSAYIEQTKKIFCGHFVCGLCSEAVKEESRRLGPEAGMEDALLSHMKICIKFNTFTRADPAAHLAMAMRQILRRSVELGVTPRPKGRLWQRTALSRSETFTARGQRKSLP